jgi:hypothetical protein
MAGPIAAPSTPAPASTAAPKSVIRLGMGKVALEAFSAIGFGLKTSPFAGSEAAAFEGLLFRQAKRNEMASH